MAIGPLELNGIISRTQDYSSMKQNEDNKGVINQSSFQQHFTQEISHKIHQVHDADDSQNSNQKFDAREKGNNSYSGDGGKKRQKREEGKVVAKNAIAGFDIRV